MSEISDWIQSNWFELGSLLVQCAMLVTLAWFGRKLLRILSASFEHNEALRGLSPSKVVDEQQTAEPAHGFATPEFESAGQGSAGRTGTSPGLIAWLQEPMGSGGIHSSNRVIRWLQAPMGS
jgi:hypothetical protein